MFEQLWEEDPRVRDIISRSEARGELKGRVEMVSSLIKKRFPDIVEEAQQKVQRIQKPEKLGTLAEWTMSAPDEKAFLWALDALIAA